MTRRIFGLDVTVHLAEDMSDDEEMEARMHAADADALGIDEWIVEGEWTRDSPFPEVVAHLLMFDPKWLFSHRWMAGWEAVPTKSEEN